MHGHRGGGPLLCAHACCHSAAPVRLSWCFALGCRGFVQPWYAKHRCGSMVPPPGCLAPAVSCPAQHIPDACQGVVSLQCLLHTSSRACWQGRRGDASGQECERAGRAGRALHTTQREWRGGRSMAQAKAGAALASTERAGAAARRA